jgi:hypothetical protein
MTDTAERDDQVTDEDRGARLRERRLAAHRTARRVFARFGFHLTLRERLAVLDEAAGVHDLDELSDLYGDGVVEALETKVAGLLGTEAAAFFRRARWPSRWPCAAGRAAPGTRPSPCTRSVIPRCTSGTRSARSAVCARCG